MTNLFAIALFTILGVIVLTFIVILTVGKYKAFSDFTERLKKNTNGETVSEDNTDEEKKKT